MTTNLPIPRWDQPQPANPYPERSNRDNGVRHHTQPAQLPDWMITDDLVASGPHLFTAALPPTSRVQARRRPIPWASTGLYALGQVALAVAIALGKLPAATGIVICVLWMICGLLLITAQTITERSAQTQ